MTSKMDGQGDRRPARRVRLPERPASMNAPSADRIAYTTCYMCACRCGIKVHLKDGGIRFIEGNPKHPVNRGVICGKGASGIMQQYSPAKLRKPLWLLRSSIGQAEPLAPACVRFAATFPS